MKHRSVIRYCKTFFFPFFLQTVPTEKNCRIGKSVAIPSLFGKPSYPTITLEPLQREKPLRNIEKSGWRDLPPIQGSLMLKLQGGGFDLGTCGCRELAHGEREGGQAGQVIGPGSCLLEAGRGEGALVGDQIGDVGESVLEGGLHGLEVLLRGNHQRVGIGHTLARLQGVVVGAPDILRGLQAR